MEKELISKKELLDLTGISYGQLYRWKRKNLIPEEWFIRKSTFTGQETFFPKDKILARVEKIKNMKEDLSLDDLADVFSPNLTGVILKKDALLEQNLVSVKTLDYFSGEYGMLEEFNFKKILFIYSLEKILKINELSADECRMVLKTLEENYSRLEGKNYDLVFLRKSGFSVCFLVSNPSEYYFESGTSIAARINLVECIEELKLKII